MGRALDRVAGSVPKEGIKGTPASGEAVDALTRVDNTEEKIRERVAEGRAK